MRRPLALTRSVARPIAFLALLLAVAGAALPVAAEDGDYGPQLSADQNVAVHGSNITITLSGFPAGQHFVLFVRPSLPNSSGVDMETLPVDVDARGGGTATISTVELAIGNYIVGISGAEGTVSAYRAAVFGVTDPGVLGPRVLRVTPLTDDDVDG